MRRVPVAKSCNIDPIPCALRNEWVSYFEFLYDDDLTILVEGVISEVEYNRDFISEMFATPLLS